ncbi:MAG: hypothetical protein ACI8RD_006163 [Bacillariaceae sp.]|jgi:hypothetical protein
MMESSRILSLLCLTAVAVLNSNNIQVTAFAPSLLSSSVNQSPQKCVTSLFSTVEQGVDTTDIIGSTSSTTSSSSSQKLPILFPSLATSLNELGFSTPTPIQSASAERALDSENLLLIAPTGSGKTLAYLLPALEKVVIQRQQKIQQTEGEDEATSSIPSNTILVVAPTRELALQLMRDTTSIISNLNNNNVNDNDNDEEDNNENKLSVLLAVKGVNMPTTEELNSSTVLIGTPEELLYVLSEVRGGQEFVAGDVLSAVVLDEVDVLLPNPPKQLRTALDNAGNGKKERPGQSGKKSNSPQDERRRQEQKRKLMAAKRNGIQFSPSMKAQVVGPTENLLKLIASRRSLSADGEITTPYQVIAGSATASRKTLDRLNKAMKDAASDASSNVDTVWNGNVKACRPDVDDVSPNSTSSKEEEEGKEKQIRAVTVPKQVKHQYLRLEKDMATNPTAVLAAVAKAAETLKPKRALLFLCGEFQKSTNAAANPISKKAIPKPGQRITQSQLRRKKQLTLKQKKLAASAISRAKGLNTGLSARKACSTLAEMGIEAKPLHVVLGLEANAKEDDNDEDAEIPPFLVTFEGSARGLHLDDIETVFVVGRPSSAASYLHLAGRVGRSSTAAGGDVVIRPGNVISFCTKGSAIELNKWTKQVGGTDLEELTL